MHCFEKLYESLYSNKLCFDFMLYSIGGSGQTCCYDDYKELLQTADTMYGGRPSRAFVYGKHPFNMGMMVIINTDTAITANHEVMPSTTF